MLATWTRAETARKRNPGFSLDSVSLEITSKRYYMDVTSGRADSDGKLAQGFRKFFIRHVVERIND
ncbi:MAG TPA: hypothetical protein VIL05_12955 [Thermoclostridium sp.]